jgi:hypothetical protein
MLLPRLASDHDPPTSSSQVTEIIGMCHHTWLLYILDLIPALWWLSVSERVYTQFLLEKEYLSALVQAEKQPLPHFILSFLNRQNNRYNSFSCKMSLRGVSPTLRIWFFLFLFFCQYSTPFYLLGIHCKMPETTDDTKPCTYWAFSHVPCSIAT